MIQAEEEAWMKALSLRSLGSSDEPGQCGWTWAVARARQDLRREVPGATRGLDAGFSPGSERRPKQCWQEERDRLFCNIQVRNVSKRLWWCIFQDSPSRMFPRHVFLLVCQVLLLYCCPVACRELGEDFRTSAPINRAALSLRKGAHGHPQDGTHKTVPSRRYPQDGVLHVTPEAAPGEGALLAVKGGVEEQTREMERRMGKRNRQGF